MSVALKLPLAEMKSACSVCKRAQPARKMSAQGMRPICCRCAYSEIVCECCELPCETVHQEWTDHYEQFGNCWSEHHSQEVSDCCEESFHEMTDEEWEKFSGEQWKN